MEGNKSDIESIGQSVTLPDDTEDIERATIIHTKKIYLEIFFNLVSFLNLKLKNEEDKNFIFYIPQLRTFFDLYSELLYLCNQDDNKQGAVCTVQLLFALASGKRYSQNNQQPNKLVEQYNNIFNYHKLVIDRYSLGVPQNIDDFSKKKLEKLGLNFPNTEKIFKQQYFKDCSFETQKIFKFDYDKFYYHYRWISNYVHGEIYSTLQTRDKKPNEKFWIIVKTIILSLLIIELVNKKILNNTREQEFKDWIKRFQLSRNNLKKVWEIRYGQNKNPTT